MPAIRKSLLGSVGISICLISPLTAQYVTAPMLPHKDGDVSSKSCEGNDRELVVRGDKHKVNVAWMTFHNELVDFQHASNAVLSLNLDHLNHSGTLKVFALTASIDKAEDRVTAKDVHYDMSMPVATMELTKDMEEMTLNLDITPAVKGAAFHGLALVSEDGLLASFSSRESVLPPIVHMRYPALTGPMGPKGDKGDQGEPGLDGVAGPQGVAGAIGPMGPIGPEGVAGATGPMGPEGAVGATGPMGPEGATGPMGPEGVAGATGPMGPEGATGPMGPEGVAGATGPKGDKGDPGEPGPMGPAGPAGPPGSGSEGSSGFGGMYVKDDCNVNTLANPLTGSLSCPAGFTAYQIGRFRASESNCGATQYMCVK